MCMPVMNIRKVWMAVLDRRMFMSMAMCSCPTSLKRMFVLMVLVVNVAMLMRHW